MSKAIQMIEFINEGRLSELWVRKLQDVADGLEKLQTTSGGGKSTGECDEAINHVKEAIKAIQGLEK